MKARHSHSIAIHCSMKETVCLCVCEREREISHRAVANTGMCISRDFLL